MAIAPGEWIEILEVGAMRLWDDQPPAATLTLAATAAELDALLVGLLRPELAPTSVHGELDAEMRSTDGSTRRVAVQRMIVTPADAAAKLYTGNGAGEGIRATDVIRILGFAAVVAPAAADISGG